MTFALSVFNCNMAIVRYIGAIASSVLNKKKKVDKAVETSRNPANTVSKEQYLKWVEEGKCGCCGAPSGEFKGICDECRFS